jgi:deferrochelatase/peroxidase EfeB
MSAMIDYSDVQGIVRYGYGQLPAASFLLLQIKNPAAARSWLRTAPVTNATAVAPPPQYALQVAFTGDGLDAMGLPRQVLEKFSPEFISGMAREESRSRRLGDVGANAPVQWHWGGPEKTPHLLVMLYAQAGALEHWQKAVQNSSWDDAFTVLRCLPSEGLSDTEPFGFKDGISQPLLDWEQMKKLPGDQVEYSNLAALGEFLLGYPNEYGKYSDRPLLPSGDDRSAGLLPAAENSDQRDLGRNGSYLVLRQLEQDVAGFWSFLDRQTEGNVADQSKLAEAMVGRRMNGEPLVPLFDRGSANSDQAAKYDTKLNQFTYESDSDGTRCPFGAHIRRVNPRNGDLPYGTHGWFQRLMRTLGFHRKSFRDDLVSSTRFHRILRRGRAYGSASSRAQALSGGAVDGHERGIYFICVNANIARQFEFVQNAWVMATKFDGLSGESDALAGNRQPIPGCPVTDVFSIPQESGLPRRIHGLPQFVTVRGGGYFFLPSIRALWYIATLGD